jgi:hypothetical protein
VNEARRVPGDADAVLLRIDNPAPVEQRRPGERWQIRRPVRSVVRVRVRHSVVLRALTWRRRAPTPEHYRVPGHGIPANTNPEINAGSRAVAEWFRGVVMRQLRWSITEPGLRNLHACAWSSFGIADPLWTLLYLPRRGGSPPRAIAKQLNSFRHPGWTTSPCWRLVRNQRWWSPYDRRRRCSVSTSSSTTRFAKRMLDGCLTRNFLRAWIASSRLRRHRRQPVGNGHAMRDAESLQG